MIDFLKTIIYVPLYNALALILNIEWVDAGIATIILTILVKLLLYPIAKKASITQFKMKEKEGELNSIKEKYKDKQEQAVKTMEFYKTNNINPFSSILTILIQIPIIYSLYYIFFKSGLPAVDASLLYSFIKMPTSVSMEFLGFFDVSKKSIVLAILAAVSSFLQMHFASSAIKNPKDSKLTSAKAPAGKEDFAQMLTKQMKYTMPIMVFIISWQISGVVALYWFVSNLAGIAQDAYIKRNFKKTTPQS